MAKVNVKSQTRSSLLCLLFLEAATNSLLHVVTKDTQKSADLWILAPEGSIRLCEARRTVVVIHINDLFLNRLHAV